jgi:Tfp pilus assembly protein PilF
MAEWRLYPAATGLLVAAASALAAPLASRRAARAIATIAVTVLAAVAYARNTRWSDPMAMWEEAVGRSPAAWQAHLGYADLLREIDRCDRAAPEYREALRLYPDQPDARAGLAACR